MGALQADVADGAACAAAIADAAARLGGLSILVNNAGAGAVKPLERYTDDEWARLVAVNLTGVWHGIRAAVPLLRTAASAGVPASVVDIAGTVATGPNRGEGPYAAAKARVVALTRTAALEYAPAVRVNSVSPRLHRHAAHQGRGRRRPAARPGRGSHPDGPHRHRGRRGGVVAFLCSPDAAYLTGQDLIVDGGSVLPSHRSDELLRALLERWR